MNMRDLTQKQINIFDVLHALIAIGVATFLIFQNLSAPAIYQWDEAIYANNALEMYATGDPIVLRRSGGITLYNTKPPFVIWLQTLSMHVIGVDEFAIRFPSALAGVLTCLLLFIFSIATLKNIRIGVIAVLVLATSYGFVRQHVVKTGDLDAMLTFWTTFYAFTFLHLLIAEPQRHRLLLTLTGIGVSGAFLTKGIAGMIPLMGLLICTCIAKKGKWLFTQRHAYVVGVGVLIVCIGYYILRESLAPGFFARTAKVDYGRFLTQTMTWHHHPWYYYFWNWQRLDFFTPYVYALPIAVVLGVISKTYRNITILLTVQALVFIGILSYPIVKLMWYDAPVYPLLALICAIGLISVWEWIERKLGQRDHLKKLLFAAFLLVVFFVPIKEMFKRNAEIRLPVDGLEREGFFVRELKQSHSDLKSYNVLMLSDQNAHFTQIDYYINAYNRYEGYVISHLKDTALVQRGDTILCCQDKQIAWLREKFDVTEIATHKIGCALMRVE